jgi:hypothetical protein
VYPSALASYLATLHENTNTSPHNITLKISNAKEFDTIKTTLNGEPNKYVNLGFKSSTITAIPNEAFYTGNPLYEDCVTLSGITLPKSVTSIGN